MRRERRPVHLKTRGPGRPQKFTEEEYAEALRRSGGVRRGAARILGCDHTVVTDACARFPALLAVEREAAALAKAHEADEQETALKIARNCHRALLTSAQGKLLTHPQRALTPSEQKALYFELSHSPLGREEYSARTEVTGREGAPIAHEVVSLGRGQVERLSDEEIEGILDGDGRLLAEAAAPGLRRAHARRAGAAPARQTPRTTH